MKRTIDGVTERTRTVVASRAPARRREDRRRPLKLASRDNSRIAREISVCYCLATHAGITRDQAMPIVPREQQLFTRTNAVTFSGLSFGGWLLHWLFGIGILLGLGRVLFIGVFAFGQWRRRDVGKGSETYQPFVSVIVPAYNEELVVVKTIESLLASNYTDFEIIVVDDGSNDRTSQVVAEAFSGENRVRLFTKQNGGKAEALNFGILQAVGEIIIALDADTLFPRTVGALASFLIHRLQRLREMQGGQP